MIPGELQEKLTPLESAFAGMVRAWTRRPIGEEGRACKAPGTVGEFYKTHDF